MARRRMTATDANAASLRALSEEDFQPQVIDLAHIYGWRHMHVRRTIGRGKRWTTGTSAKGWPDLTLWSPRHHRLMFVELKTETGKTDLDQLVVLGELSESGAHVHLWRPHDLDAMTACFSGHCAGDLFHAQGEPHAAHHPQPRPPPRAR
jgi:hypothetical protein